MPPEIHLTFIIFVFGLLNKNQAQGFHYRLTNWQIPLTESQKSEKNKKESEKRPEGSFQYKRVPFGLHGAPALFQRMMDKK